jgi:hypothetical protein
MLLGGAFYNGLIMAIRGEELKYAIILEKTHLFAHKTSECAHATGWFVHATGRFVHTTGWFVHATGWFVHATGRFVHTTGRVGLGNYGVFRKNDHSLSLDNSPFRLTLIS